MGLFFSLLGRKLKPKKLFSPNFFTMVTPAVHIKHPICSVHFGTKTAAGVKLIIPLEKVQDYNHP